MSHFRYFFNPHKLLQKGEINFHNLRITDISRNRIKFSLHGLHMWHKYFFLAIRKYFLLQEKEFLRQEKMFCPYIKKTFPWNQKSFLRELICRLKYVNFVILDVANRAEQHHPLRRLFRANFRIVVNVYGSEKGAIESTTSISPGRSKSNSSD